ncbi:30S ribosomal protein S8 [candidate division WOR-1 bacterium RIFOXYB2_FULL_42_35]|uniref:Small ribosomal subunit protein uS8 n=1 Tax=candidate division WOR-1 bacterium RIFOXYC2_FULL_41_25 TaxID=1802586 RepID=A0A1F4TLY1_UNCSA|nr:MAG: 30S ribosomal protein S8 [candidate division WOR-1 bacterium RIFOXYA2_FULL_41_14]OGC23867.1 MAG: 30S ribosomal protein S8 [candidate division WOR-1 bacterium RIFOXYB2_FULL_42_35]OGC33742.1 MAG: 30S ribosomal protein S8 [candidate division WOR-1 bacterium RIFOXYC2_FULL_41_25]OGC42503.1 MAG: 30S ribosomal protein S8 [candidate division WOR-1 bacterium RIFOXYD2_FULL_41_8]
MTDPIADMLSRIKNGLNTRAEIVDVPHSNIKEKLAQIIKSEGYLAKAETLSKMGKKYLRLRLKYGAAKQSVIENLKRVSKPGRRVYCDVKSIPRVQGGFGVVIISTSRGIMTGASARSQKLGGEILCYVW